MNAMYALRRSRGSRGSIGHNPYCHPQDQDDKTSDHEDLLLGGGGKIRSRSSIGSLSRKGGRGKRKKRQSVPELSSHKNNSVHSRLRRSTITNDSREELQLELEGRSSSVKQECQSTTSFLRRPRRQGGRGYKSSSSSSSQRVSFNVDASEEHKNEEWGEVSPPTDAATATAKSSLLSTQLSTSRNVDGSPPSSISNLIMSSGPFVLGGEHNNIKNKLVRKTSQPIPINTVVTAQEIEDKARSEHLSVHCDSLTWQMYTRIKNARQSRAYATLSRGGDGGSMAAKAVARHELKVQDTNPFRSTSVVPLERGIQEQEEKEKVVVKDEVEPSPDESTSLYKSEESGNSGVFVFDL